MSEGQQNRLKAWRISVSVQYRAGICKKKKNDTFFFFFARLFSFYLLKVF